MSWPSSNFHHDSFEYINPPRPEYKPSSFHISHNTYIKQSSEPVGNSHTKTSTGKDKKKKTKKDNKGCIIF